MSEITTGKPHPLKGRPSPVKGHFYLDKHAPRLIAEGNGADTEPDDLLTTDQVAAWFQVSKQWLEIRRSNGNTDGPPFVKMSDGRIRYRRSTVIAWLEERDHYRSTAEYRQPKPDELKTELPRPNGSGSGWEPPRFPTPHRTEPEQSPDPNQNRSGARPQFIRGK